MYYADSETIDYKLIERERNILLPDWARSISILLPYGFSFTRFIKPIESDAEEAVVCMTQ